MIVYAFALIIMILWSMGVTWKVEAALRDLGKLEKEISKLCPCF